jgi:hypothetical protein
MAALTCECDRINVQLPSLICDPTIAKDPKRTPAKVSIADLEELQRKFLSNHVINGHDLVSKLSICFGRYHYKQGNMFRQTKHTYREKKAVKRQREREHKKLTSWISDCRHCFYPVRCGKRSGVLQKLLMQLGVHAHT